MPKTSFPSLRGAAFALAAATFALPAAAQVTVADAWVRGTVAGQKATGAFTQLTSPAGHGAGRGRFAGGRRSSRSTR